MGSNLEVMKKEFIPYAEALALKELGFDEECFGRYYYKKSYPMLNPQSEETELVFEFGQYLKQTEITILVPTFSQAFRFFREKYGLFAEITLWGDGLGYISMIKEIKQEEFIEVYKKDIVDTGLPIWEYEESETACLKKLIGIVKEKFAQVKNIL